jgi:outer membrane protein insertion porin family
MRAPLFTQTKNHIAPTIRRLALLFLVSTLFLHSTPLASKSADARSSMEQQQTQESITPAQNQSQEAQAPIVPSQPKTVARTIRKIIVSGNKYVSTDAILSRIPYKVGEIFNPLKTKSLIKNLYYGLQRFRTIDIQAENVGENTIDLYITVQEKKLLQDIDFQGNKQVSSKDLKAKTGLADVVAVDEEELKRFAQGIKKLYQDKGFHHVDVTTKLQEKNGKSIAIFVIKEYPKSIVKQVRFIGNKHISSKSLRSNIFTREDWLLSFLDKAGTYQPDRIEGDKYLIEQYYQNNGFLNAKVVDVDTKIDPKKSTVVMTFDIQEGDQFTISEVKAPGNDILSEEYLLSQIPVRPGQLYSKEMIMTSIKRLEWIWGEQGYLFSHIEPSIQPDDDKKTVSLAFYTELGSKVKLHKVTIKGNKKTQDRIIRRKVMLDEGELLTNSKMERTKDAISGLGYFEQQDGVNWKITRLSEDLADLDLLVKEAKTGHFHLKLGFGGAGIDPRSPSSGLSIGGELADVNLFGTGIAVNLQGTWAKDEQNIFFHIANPWLFDKPILGAFDAYHRRPTYDEFHHMQAVNEKLTGGALTAGFVARSSWLDDIQCVFSSGLDNLRYEKRLQFIFESDIQRNEPAAVAAYKSILCREFTSGSFLWFTNKIEQDMRNHPMHPSRGYNWLLTTRIAAPTLGDNISFYRITLDANWFTPLIGENDLVFRLHGNFGFAAPFKNRVIPFAELFHIGGPNSVRGFLYGQIGPTLLGDSMGAKKALFVNAELIFPITPDFNMKGVVFYDGGAGWDSPYTQGSENLIRGNSFDYRQSVGVGIRLLNPMPIRVDWGFKLDPRRDRFNPKNSESASEVHFTMSYDW